MSHISFFLFFSFFLVWRFAKVFDISHDKKVLHCEIQWEKVMVSIEFRRSRRRNKKLVDSNLNFVLLRKGFAAIHTSFSILHKCQLVFVWAKWTSWTCFNFHFLWFLSIVILNRVTKKDTLFVNFEPWAEEHIVRNQPIMESTHPANIEMKPDNKIEKLEKQNTQKQITKKILHLSSIREVRPSSFSLVFENPALSLNRWKIAQTKPTFFPISHLNIGTDTSKFVFLLQYLSTVCVQKRHNWNKVYERFLCFKSRYILVVFNLSWFGSFLFLLDAAFNRL